MSISNPKKPKTEGVSHVSEEMGGTIFCLPNK
jgi:hypothetical protein